MTDNYRTRKIDGLLWAAKYWQRWKMRPRTPDRKYSQYLAKAISDISEPMYWEDITSIALSEACFGLGAEIVNSDGTPTEKVAIYAPRLCPAWKAVRR